MSKKSSNLNWLGLLSFAALLISGICLILNALNIGSGVLSLIAQIALMIVVLWCAWSYAKKLNKTWRIIYIILAVIAIVGLAFGGYSLL